MHAFRFPVGTSLVQTLSGSHLGKFSGSNQQGFLPPVKRKALTFETRFCRLESEKKNRN
jgi:hypothetical protein